MHCLLGILKLIKSCEYDDVYILIIIVEPPGQLKTIHIWHLDVRYDHIRLQFLHQFKSLNTVVGTSHDIKSEHIPVDLSLYNIYNLFLVIDKDNLVFIHITGILSIYQMSHLLFQTRKPAQSRFCLAFIKRSQVHYTKCGHGFVDFLLWRKFPFSILAGFSILGHVAWRDFLFLGLFSLFEHNIVSFISNISH